MLFAAWLFGVSGLVIICSGLLLLFVDFSRDALRVPAAGYAPLATTDEDSSARSSSSDTASSSGPAAVDAGHKQLVRS